MPKTPASLIGRGRFPDLLAHSLDRRAQAFFQQRIRSFPDLRVLTPAATADRVNVSVEPFGSMPASYVVAFDDKNVLQSVTGDSDPTAWGTAPGFVIAVLRQSCRMLDEPHAGLSPAKTNPVLDAIGAMMAAQISDTVGQDVVVSTFDRHPRRRAEAHGGSAPALPGAGSLDNY